MSGPETQQSPFWKSLSKLDWIAVVLCVAGIAAAKNPLSAHRGAGLVQLFGVLAAGYVLYRFWSRWRAELLWSLRNRLILAYLFLGVVPTVLLLILASMLGQILYSQLGAYLLYHDIEDRVAIMSNLAATEASLPASADEKATEKSLTQQPGLSAGQK